jgi:hypothetical protein
MVCGRPSGAEGSRVCREQFTVTVGTVFESSKIPLSKWLAALFLMTEGLLVQIPSQLPPKARFS